MPAANRHNALPHAGEIVGFAGITDRVNELVRYRSLEPIHGRDASPTTKGYQLPQNNAFDPQWIAR